MAGEIKLLEARQHYKARLLIGLVFKPLRLFCEHCGKYVASDTEWECGVCNFFNKKTRYYSFLNKCKNCKRSPKAFECPHVGCNNVNFLDDEKDGKHPAKLKGIPAPPVDAEEERRLKREDRLDTKEDLEHRITLAKLNLELKNWEQPNDNKSPREKLRDLFEQEAAQTIAVHEIADHELALKRQEHKDNPVALQRAEKFINDWRESRLL
jgi:ribosomal protein L37E